MKKRWIPLVVLAICTTFVLGLWGGQALLTNEQTETPAQQTNQQTTIAVINSDTGVEVDGIRQNFAAAMIETLGEDFVIVSPAMAHRGFSDGLYSAIVTFPAQVSQQVISFNAYEPERVQLDFMINTTLSERDYIDTHKQILDLQQSMNTVLSQTFITSIFGQFHSAQDQIEHIFNNDASTLEALDIIYFRNFTTGLELEQIPAIPFEPNSLDTSSYLLSVTDFAETISSIYLDSYNSATGEYELMRAQIIGLTDDFPLQKDAWIGELSEWTGISQSFGISLEEFAESFEDFMTITMALWYAQWSEWHEGLVRYEKDVDSYSSHVYEWLNGIDYWRDDHLSFLNAVEERVDELNDRLSRLGNIPEILIDFEIWYDLLSKHSHDLYAQFNETFDKYNTQIAEADTYWETLAGWRITLTNHLDEMYDWYENWESDAEELFEKLTSWIAAPNAPPALSTMSNSRTPRPLIPTIPSADVLESNPELDAFVSAITPLINWSDSIDAWGAGIDAWSTNMDNWRGLQINWSNTIYSFLSKDMVEFFENEIPGLTDELPEIPETPVFNITFEVIDWEENIDLTPPEHEIREFLQPMRPLPDLADLIPPRDVIYELPEFPEFDTPMPLTTVPHFEDVIPCSPLIAPPPQPDDFWSALNAKQDMLNTFNPDNFLTDAYRQNVQGMTNGFGTYLDFIRNDVERHFNTNIFMLYDVYNIYGRHLSDLRSEALRSEADSITYLHGQLEEYFGVTHDNSTDTQDRLQAFADMMPESRTYAGVNRELVDFTILPIEAVPLAARPEINVSATPESGQSVLFVSFIALGAMFIVTGAIYAGIYIKRKFV